MRRLIVSNLWRLGKMKVFWLAMLAVVLNSLLAIGNNVYYKNLWGLDLSPEGILFSVGSDYAFSLGVSIVIGLLIGNEFGDKTIRNKVLGGHSKGSIYMANIVTSVFASLLLYGVGIFTILFLGTLMLGEFQVPFCLLLPQLGCSVVSAASLAVLLAVLSLLIANRVFGSIAALLAAFGMMFYCEWLSILAFDGFDTSRGKQIFYTICLDALPAGQFWQYTSELEEVAEPLWRFPVYSLVLMLLVGGIGFIYFTKKNLK